MLTDAEQQRYTIFYHNNMKLQVDTNKTKQNTKTKQNKIKQDTKLTDSQVRLTVSSVCIPKLKKKLNIYEK